MTINETKVVPEVITVCGKTMRFSYVEDVMHKEEPFSEWQIKSLHRHVLKGIDDSYAGVYCDQQVFISEAVHTLPPPFKFRN